MEGILSAYLSSTWGLSVTILLTVIFSAKAYDTFAKLWLAHTGNFRVDGKITYSEFMQQPAWTGTILGKDLNEGLITYSYRVEGNLYTGKIPADSLTQELVDKHYFMGAPVDVYYSPRLPAYSFTGAKPNKTQIAQKALLIWFVLPVGILSLVSLFIWALMDLAQQA